MPNTRLAVGSRRAEAPYLADLRAERVLPPFYPAAGTQPTLPWRPAPELAPARKPVDPSLYYLAESTTATIVEVLNGRRSSSQLRAKFVPSVVHLIDHLRKTKAAKGLRIRSVHAQLPARGALEVWANLREDEHSIAVSMRLVQHSDTWVCTKLEIGTKSGLVLRSQ